MTFAIDYREGDVLRWAAGDDGATCERDAGYTPTFYVASETPAARRDLESHLSARTAVVETTLERWRTVWREESEPVLRVDARNLDALTDLAHEIRGWGPPGRYTLYNVDFTREFRYCLETGLRPVPETPQALTTLEISVPARAVSDGEIAPLALDGERVATTPAGALDELAAALSSRDPDVLVVRSADLLPLVFQTARAQDRTDFALGRRPGWQQLAGESTFESYGQVGHSPARYSVPGRAIVDRSNSFFWSQTNLAGLLDLVERSHKPLQETAWASIGNVLTAIQIREALSRGVLVPWNSWRHEQFKSMSTLQRADRGGFTFSPDVGFHEDVHELDFSSLYPNIMVTRNVSPDTIQCSCHAERADVPDLGYSICDERGFIADVLEPIVADRDEYKAERARLEDRDGEGSGDSAGPRVDGEECANGEGPVDIESRIEELTGRSSALKWILVSCFGYQGFSNAKFGRIECHEAINAFAREILLDTKEMLEAEGWRVVHGIVDSVWVQAVPGESQTPLNAVASDVTDHVGIELEYEAAYDWIAFVPRRDSEEGALNRYFGKVANGESFKKRGIELRQRSTPTFVEDCQERWLETLDEHREPAPVCEQLRLDLAELRAGEVDPADLLIRRRVSQERDAYSQYTRNVAALERAAIDDFDVAPGEDVEYVVVDDEKRSAARVNLAYEALNRYDEDFYADLLVRAAESLLLPFGWDRERIRSHLAEREDATITMY